MTIFDSFPSSNFNAFTRSYFDLQSTYVKDALSKADFYTVEEYLRSMIGIIDAFAKYNDSINIYGASLLSKTTLLSETLRSSRLRSNPFLDENIELKFKRLNEIVTVQNEFQNLNLSGYIGEQKLISPVGGIVPIELDLSKLINNQKPNALMFDILDSKGKAVKIKDVKSAQQNALDDNKSIISNFDPRTLESKGLLPLKDFNLGNVRVSVESQNPVRINKLQPIIIKYDNVAITEELDLVFESPKKGFEIKGYDSKSQVFGKANFDLEITLTINEVETKFINPKFIYFGTGSSNGNVYYLNLDTTPLELKFVAKLIKKSNIPVNKILDFSTVRQSFKKTSREELKTGVKFDNLLELPRLYKEVSFPITKEKAISIGTSSYTVLSEDLRLIDANTLLRISNGTSTQALGTNLSDTSFTISDGIVLNTNLSGEKVIWYEDQFNLDYENQKLKVKSNLQLSKLSLNNLESGIKTEHVFRYKDYRKTDLNVVELPLNRQIEDIRLVTNKTPVTLSSSTEEVLSTSQYKAKNNKLYVYIEESAQPFSNITVFGKSLSWESVSGDFKNDAWYFEIKPSHTSTPVSGDVTIPGQVINNSIKVGGYQLLDHNNTKMIERMRLSVSSSSNGTSFFDIPYKPYSNLTVEGMTSYGTSSDYVYSTATATQITVSYLSLPLTDDVKMYWVEGRQIKFLNQPLESVVVSYEYINGYFEGLPVAEVPFYQSDLNTFGADITSSGSYVFRYYEGETKDINVSHPQKLNVKVLGI